MKVPLTLLAGGLFLAVLAGTAPISAADTPAPTGVTWQSAGDSYSSGEGVFGNTGACAQSDKAYGPVAIRKLRDDHGWKIDNTTFTACTGHLIEDFFHARGDGGRKGSLWGWGLDQGGPDRVDVLTMSFGGNDIGFAAVISDCVLVPTSFSEVVTGGIIGAGAGGPEGAAVGVALSGLTGCDTHRVSSNHASMLCSIHRTGPVVRADVGWTRTSPAHWHCRTAPEASSTSTTTWSPDNSPTGVVSTWSDIHGSSPIPISGRGGTLQHVRV